MNANAIERAARWSDPGYLIRVWEAANGTWNQPNENELRAFLMRLAVHHKLDSRDVEPEASTHA